jgi:endoglucanase
MTGLNVMLAHDFYPEGHQGGVGVIQNGQRVATNGDLRLEPTPGQWQPQPAVGKREVDRATGRDQRPHVLPRREKDRKGFNPISYPDLDLGYVIKVRPDGHSFRIVIDLDKPLPAAWVGKVGFNLELFPGSLFGKSYVIGDHFGTFPRQANGPGAVTDGDYELNPLGNGPEAHGGAGVREPAHDDRVGQGRRDSSSWTDGRSTTTAGSWCARLFRRCDDGRVEWLVTPNAIPGWKSDPVVQVSQVGYHPKQSKIAVIELDSHETVFKPVTLYKATAAGLEKVAERPATDWGRFLRYHYLQFDFSTSSSRACTSWPTATSTPTRSRSASMSSSATCGSRPSSTSCPCRWPT